MKTLAGRDWQGMPETQKDLASEISSQVFPEPGYFWVLPQTCQVRMPQDGTQESPANSWVVTAGLGSAD